MTSDTSTFMDTSRGHRAIEGGEALVVRGRMMPNAIAVLFFFIVSAGMIIPPILNLEGLIDVHWRSGRLFTRTESIVWLVIFGSILSYAVVYQFQRIQLRLDKTGFELKFRKRTTGYLSTNRICRITLYLRSRSKRVRFLLDLSELEPKQKPFGFRDKSMTVTAMMPAEQLTRLLEIARETNLPTYFHNGVGEKKLSNAATGGPS